MKCSQCESERIVEFSCKCSDLSYTRWWDGKEQSGYVPSVLGIGDGSGDYVELELCINCGQLQNFEAEANEKYKKKDKCCKSLKE